MVSDIPPSKQESMGGDRYKNPNAEEITGIGLIFLDALIKERVKEAKIASQKEIYDLLLNELKTRVPYDTRENRPPGKPHLRDKIVENSRIEGDTVIVGSGDYVDPYTDYDYDYWLNHGFARKISATKEKPATTWPAKRMREHESRLDDPYSVTPYLHASAYKNLKNIARIVIRNLKKSLRGLDFVSSIETSGSIEIGDVDF